MTTQYAVISAGDGRVLFHTPDYSPEAPARSVPLSDGVELRISGEETLLSDNRELLRQLQEARDANAAKEAFLSNMSHDIRTPMNAIVGMTALAKKHIDEKGRVADALNKIEVASGHLLSLINDVLDMSRINSGKMVLNEAPFFLGELLHDTLTITRPQAEQKGHSLRFHVGDIYEESLFGDALRLRQVFVNIINNAVKYTPAGGEITVSVEQEPPAERCPLVFRCRDNGIGMTAEFLEKIFEPFERVNSSTISKIEGTGLGMSIVKKLVDARGGEISLESAPGKGTLVTIRLPLRWEASGINAAALESRRLLVLGADPELASLYRRYFEESGLSFRLESSSSDAIAALTEADFRGESFDAVILGKQIREAGRVLDLADYLHRSYPALALLLFSEDDWSRIEYHANRSGIEHFLPVPFFRQSLLRALAETLSEAAGDAPQSAAPDLAGKRILLAEDNFINREIACEILGSTGARVDTAEDGAKAVERYLASAEGAYSLVLMDIQMPEMDGYAAAAAIRASGRSDAALPIYAMTANTFAEDIAKARQAGMDGHIAKPIDVRALMQVLRKI